MTAVSIIGAGAFGTALAISLARTDRNVTLWGRNIDGARENTSRLPGHPFPEALRVTNDLAQAASADTLLLCIPMQKTGAFLHENSRFFQEKTLICCSKGIDLETGKGAVATITSNVPNAIPAILSGPSFAVDIAQGLPTALTIAAKNPEPLQHLLSSDTLRLYRSQDMTGVELGGALKNVIAIACGVAIGAGLGESARAALMTRGYAEMNRFAIAQGAEPTTLSGLSGFGDLTLTCTSEKSRNFAFGLALGRDTPPDESKTVEGRATAKAVSNLAKKAGIDMPIANMVAAVSEGAITITEATEMLLARPLKEE